MTVSCYSDANPPAVYSWYRIKQRQFGGEDVTQLVYKNLNGALSLYNVSPNDTARYKCIAMNTPNDIDTTKEEKSERIVNIIVRCKHLFLFMD